MNDKFQPKKFGSVNEMLNFIPETERELSIFLRTLVLSCIPNCNERLAYNVPYYRVNRDICFIWPASVLWGKKKTYEGVRLGFMQGHLLSDEFGYLERAGRKRVFWRDFESIAGIEASILKTYIFEAVEVDKAFDRKPLRR
jgi:hypothetical protein